jgi:hypothetical protein
MPMHRIRELAETRLPAPRAGDPGTLNVPPLMAQTSADAGTAQSGTEIAALVRLRGR